MSAQSKSSRDLTMKFAGGLVKHLGLQMYSGAVSAIAELIANAWDADASRVEIQIPLGVPITDGLEIEVRDNGGGMSFEEVDLHYLLLGRNRRSEGDYSKDGRQILGRKGIGKLAGFGIARQIEVWTAKDGWLTAFLLDYDEITKHETASLVESYSPPVLRDRKLRSSDPIQQGTMVRLKRLQLKQAIPDDRFRNSMGRRFSLLSGSFQVVINGKKLQRGQVPLQFRFPEKGMNSEEIKGLGTIRWWAGFTHKPIAVDEVRGIAVLARNKLVQQPFFFEMAGGVQGQHGLAYMTGEVHADLLDEEVDLVATNRASVMWEDPRAQPLLEWGRAKVRELLRSWASLRLDENKKRLRDTTPFMELVERFPEREQKELFAAIDKLASIETISDDRLAELVNILIRAFENDHFMSVIRALNSADEKTHQEVAQIIEEWDVIEAINTAQVVRGRVEVIRTFGGMITGGVPEKPDMQDFVKNHPWLLDPAWEVLQHEKSLDRVIAEEFNLEPSGESDGQKRLDYFCLSDSSMCVVVEVKRPSLLIGRKELEQLEEYVDFLTRWNASSTGSRRKRQVVKGCLVYSRIKRDAEEKRDRLRQAGMEVVTWAQLLETAERLHREFLDVVKSRAPQDDPRIKGLD